MSRSVKDRLKKLERQQEDDIEIEDLEPLYREIFGIEHHVYKNFVEMTKDGKFERQLKREKFKIR